MGDTVAAAKVEPPPPPPPRPTITVPPRTSFESFFGGGSFAGFSPGPMTLISSFFSDQDNNNSSFSQLLAGAMASPVAKTNSFSFVLDHDSSSACGGGGGSGGGYKQNRPVELVVRKSPVFMVPPGLSPSGLLNSPGGFLSPLQSPFGMSHQQALAHVTAQAALSQSFMHLQPDFQQSTAPAPTEPSQDQSCSLADENIQSDSVGMVPEYTTVKTESSEIFHSDRKIVVASVEKLENDGYNWRKYGQKQVKASEYPRSYYKCTHAGCCPVKKKVERSRDGHVTEITYKGQHNHDPPQSNKRAKDGSLSIGTSSSRGNTRNGSQYQINSITYSPTILAPEDGQLSSQQHPVLDGPQGISVPVNNENDNDQPNAKRRCMDEAGESGDTQAHKTVTESRIIVQTRSEVDLLDDGYKWRKYGQKVVKGNPYPRSYYRCTHTGCNVRKHVERASTDSKNVITTYGGKHNHVIPAAKNRGSNGSKKQ